MLADEPANQFPHPYALKLEAITIKPVPLFNRTKCAPLLFSRPVLVCIP